MCVRLYLCVYTSLCMGVCIHVYVCMSAMADLGDSKESVEPLFGFSYDIKLWKPGLHHNPTD